MAEANGGVGSTVVFENDKVKVWNFELQPGEETPMHRHDHSYIWYAISGGPLGVSDEHGNDLGVFEVPTGAVFNIRHNGNELEILSSIGRGDKFPLTHKAKNIGDSPYREILIEFKE